MAGIKQVLIDMMARLKQLPAAQTVRIWNNQVQYEAEGKYPIMKPAIFLEVIGNVQYDQLGEGLLTADLGFNFHIVHEYMHGEGDFEQDLLIFELRDAVFQAISGFRPTGCGGCRITGESQSYDHTNIYEYTVSAVCNFIDSNGSRWNPETTTLKEKEPPTTFTINPTLAHGTIDS